MTATKTKFIVFGRCKYSARNYKIVTADSQHDAAEMSENSSIPGMGSGFTAQQVLTPAQLMSILAEVVPELCVER